MKWAVKSYFAPDERSKGEWKTLKTFDVKGDAERFAEQCRANSRLWAEYHVCEVRERIKVTREERRFIDIMDKAFRTSGAKRKAVDGILADAADALEAELHLRSIRNP